MRALKEPSIDAVPEEARSPLELAARILFSFAKKSDTFIERKAINRHGFHLRPPPAVVGMSSTAAAASAAMIEPHMRRKKKWKLFRQPKRAVFSSMEHISGDELPQDEPPKLIRQNATAGKSLKRPAAEDFFEDDPDDYPNLAKYFDEWDLIDKPIAPLARINICRKYASYLASTLPPQEKKAKTQKKK